MAQLQMILPCFVLFVCLFYFFKKMLYIYKMMGDHEIYCGNDFMMYVN